MNLSNYVECESSPAEGIKYFKHKHTGHKIVLKNTDLIKGVREVRAYKKLEDSPLLDVVFQREKVFLFMYRWQGKNLLEFTNKKEREKLASHVDTCLESAIICLNRIHEQSICHGRITPEKIIVADDYSVKIVGFGHSTLLDEHREQYACFYDYFTPPEVVFNQVHTPKAIDYFSLGRCFMSILEKSMEKISFHSLEKIQKMCSIVPTNRIIVK